MGESRAWGSLPFASGMGPAPRAGFAAAVFLILLLAGTALGKDGNPEPDPASLQDFESNGDPALQQRFIQKRNRKAFDLAFTELVFTPGRNAPCKKSIDAFPFDVDGGVQLSIGDERTVELDLDFTFPFFGQQYSSVYVATNGYVTLGAPDGKAASNTKSFNKFPRVAALMSNIVPDVCLGEISYLRDSEKFVVTAQNMRHARDASSAVNYQIALQSDGTVTIAHTKTTLDSNKIKATVGLSSGVVEDKKRRDLSGYDECVSADLDSTKAASSCSLQAEGRSFSGRSSSGRGKSKIPAERSVSFNRIALEDRIIGGVEASPGRYPYMVFVQGCTSLGCFSCGGSLIAPNVVLTAAHCNGDSQTVFIGGSNLIHDEFDEIPVKNAYEHPMYDPVSIKNDVLILELERESEEVPIILDKQGSQDGVDLPQSGNPGKLDLTVAGWGVTEAGGGSDTLREVKVDYMTHGDCKAAYGSDMVTADMMCAAAAGKDSCQGDSGGPLFVKDKDDEGNYLKDVQVGIVSWGFGCADPSFPGVYSRVSVAMQFIDETLGFIGAKSRDPCP
eukprot:CAMPEP_0117674750 /NCGR_PEP_ID=MMETSP0804-20121206/15212_1 /TAXON_ID=1074897 /ORGANISM="Tetraselmis astigmatica, Strain CCMP880" /LENGTH=559 /DNA_ID=CAMNT_0005483655 /DNA_START=132 /DNA_END=1811 /DNA_ORIENTATION=+